MLYQLKKYHQKRLTRSKRFKIRDQISFFQELGELLQSGYSISQSLDILASAHSKWYQWLTEVRSDLNRGLALHIILKKDVSSQILLQLKLADQHGNLSETLVAIGENLAKLQQQQNKVMQVMRYPLILLSILGAMLVGLKYLLYPILNQWQDRSTISATSNHAYNYFFGGIACLLLLGLGIVWQRKTARQRLIILVKIPVIRTIAKTIVTYQVTQQLATLLASGLTVPEILEEMVQSNPKNLKSTVFAIVNHAHNSLKQGQTIENYVLAQPYFNRSLAGYFSRGHKPKELAKYLSYYAKTQFQLLMQQTDRLINTLQPLFFGIIGIAIVGLYMSMLLPMYQSIGGLYQ
ncbi:type II secretion system F family protein [Leuconostoc rapi]|uniref:type II secretion system F family protein n=1 Tax=Leuconostoc rapi TaxID=1406906 RepID=UPI00195B39A6|nr:type II secretion system F family protein [Leuconostoc rapi]MBM7436246.1 competence protein ComGB [Leuconostoc rapi]